MQDNSHRRILYLFNDRSIKYSNFLLVLVIWLSPIYVQAQNEVETEINSLNGIQSMGFRVNYEANSSLAAKEEAGVTSLQEMGENLLKEAQIKLISNQELMKDARAPLLHMHINAMDAGRGLVPFAISLRFFQPVKLPLNRDKRTMGSTWESSTLGIVSHDQLHIIKSAAHSLLKEFTADYHQINNPGF